MPIPIQRLSRPLPTFREPSSLLPVRLVASRRGVTLPALIPTALLLLAGMLINACSSSFDLDRPLVPGPQDWLQEGGDAGRGGRAAHDLLAEQPQGVGGGTVWEYSQDGPSARAAPLLVDNVVLFSSTTGELEMVDARSGENLGGTNCGWFIHATPAVADGHLFVATAGADPLLLCFDLTAWTKRYETRFPSAHAALCAVDGGVVAVSRGGRVALLAATDSAMRWSVELEDAVSAAPAAGDSLLVVAGQNGDLTALSLRDGGRRWRLPTGAAFMAGPAVSAGAVAAVNVQGSIVLAGLHDGVPRWSRSFGQPVWQRPAWRGDSIAVALSGGEIVLLRAADGGELGRFAVGGLPGAAPLFAGGHILQLLRDGRLMAIDISSGSISERARLPHRSETPVLVTPFGIVMVDEEGEAVCFR